MPPFVSGGGAHSLTGGGGGPNSDEGTDTVILKVYVLCDVECRLTER